jgi:UDP-3-O-[3-hydroxymyristoyl] glucosamine N-acyltransferase
VPSYTTADLAERVHGELNGRSDLGIEGVNALDEASERQITFITDKAHADLWAGTRAAAAVITDGLDANGHDPSARALIVVPNASLAMVELLHLFAPPPLLPDTGVHPTAWVHPDAAIGRDVRIGPHVSVDRDASIGDRVVLYAGVRIYAESHVGDDSILHANTVVRERCRLGRRVITHQNVSIGADGFGFEPAPDGSGLLHVPQIGNVELGDDVEIGAATCIDRAKFGTTAIGAGTKIDNLVQIAHNCRIGRSCVIAALCGLAGSVTVGDGVSIGGATAVAPHVTIGNGVSLGACSGVMRDIPPGQTCLGSPATEAREALRQAAALQRLPGWMREVSRRLDSD